MLAPFVISRTFAAPLDLVYKCWSDPKEYGNWSGPKGSVIDVIHFDFRPGGRTHYKMTAGDNVSYGASAYITIEPNTRLEWLNSFADEHGNAIKPPFSADWPLYLHTVVTFTPMADNETAIQIQWLPYEATAVEEAVFDGARDGMTQGWTGSLDALTEYIGTLCSVE
jgi:uncharacterized protein YndB with AHSA1/START domain